MKLFCLFLIICTLGQSKTENCLIGSVAEGNCRTLSGFISGITGSDIFCKQLYVSNTRILTNPKALQTGSQVALPAEFPHMAALGYETGNGIVWDCAGILISNRHILTAAQCLNREVKLVRLGDLLPSSSKSNPGRQEYTVRKQVKHPEYQSRSFYNDVGVLEINIGATTTSDVISSCLNVKKEIGDEIFSVSGWGKADNFSLRKSSVKVLKGGECNKSYVGLESGVDEEKQFCAVGIKTEICKGDIGGPLQKATNKGYVTYGIISVGNDCGKSDAPPVFTRVSKYLPWIKSVIAN